MALLTTMPASMTPPMKTSTLRVVPVRSRAATTNASPCTLWPIICTAPEAPGNVRSVSSASSSEVSSTRGAAAEGGGSV